MGSLTPGDTVSEETGRLRCRQAHCSPASTEHCGAQAQLTFSLPFNQRQGGRGNRVCDLTTVQGLLLSKARAQKVLENHPVGWERGLGACVKAL